MRSIHNNRYMWNLLDTRGKKNITHIHNKHNFPLFFLFSLPNSLSLISLLPFLFLTFPNQPISSPNQSSLRIIAHLSKAISYSSSIGRILRVRVYALK